jgi:hypothetical protein
MNEPNDFNSQFKQLCELFEAYLSAGFGDTDAHNAFTNAAISLMPAIKDEIERLRGESESLKTKDARRTAILAQGRATVMEVDELTAELSSKNEEVERLRESLTAQSEAVHFHECTVGSFFDCLNPACTKAQEVLEVKK